MIDVGRNNRPPARYLVAYKLGGDYVGCARAKVVPRVLLLQGGILRLPLLAPHAFTDGDILHFGCDDAATRIVHLRDILTVQRFARLMRGLHAQQLTVDVACPLLAVL